MHKNAMKFYIDGRWVDPITPKSLDVINPATEQPIGQISLGSEQDVDIAVQAAKRAFESFSQTSKDDRIAMLETILRLYKERWNDLASVISAEMGAPIKMATSSQVGAGFGQMNSVLEALKDFEFEREVGPRIIVREPIGVCGLITPWNWPINQVGAKVAPALAAGCTMVLKPSEIAPYDAMLLADIIHDAGVPAGVFNLINGEGPTVGAAMSAHADIDMMSFTGSTRAGSAVAQAGAAGVKRIAQELGGKSANILLDDVDFEKIVMRDVFTCMGNTGQSCNAPTRMLVPQSRMEEVAAIAAKTISKIKVGDPASTETHMGPQVSELQWGRVQSLIGMGIDEGAQVITGGLGKPDGLETGYYTRPTIFAGVTNDMTIAREEIFGPVLSIIGYKDEEDAIAIANDTLYGLAGYVSSADHDRAVAVARRIRAGQIMVNGPAWDINAPFGGYKHSGNGREGGIFGLEDFLETKAIIGGVVPT